MERRLLIASMCLAAFVSLPAFAQDSLQNQPTTTTTTTTTQSPDETTQQQTTVTRDENGNVVQMDQTPIFRVNVVARTLDAVNYRNHSDSKVDLVGTALMPEAKGDATVTTHSGRMSVRTDIDHMRKPTSFGPQYLTYVLWAITPEGRPVNLGEVFPSDDGKSKMQVTTQLQAFGLMVTAEPYFAVTRPSNTVVMENQIRHDTKGWEQPVAAKYELLDRGEYTADIDPNQLPATIADRHKVPLNLLEARNAVAIADSEGAEQYAPDAMARAKDFLAKGEDYLHRKQGDAAIGTVTRGAVQSAEDARLITLRKKRDERVAKERREQQERVDEARQRADDERNRAQTAQDQARVAQDAAAEARQEREAALQAKRDADEAAAKASQERAAAEEARRAAVEQQQVLASQTQQAQLQAQQAQAAAQRAEQEKEETRARLMNQLNQVLQTKDTARGLIVNMSDVLFDTNKATLRPGAKLRLAKVGGIIQAYPDLHLQIEGFTDSTGTPEYNQQLSEKRAEAVREFLASQGVSEQSITAHGFGQDNPVASNTTAAGRQQNRRVDLVVSGESIQSARSQGISSSVDTTGGVSGGTPGTSATGTYNQTPGMVQQPATASPVQGQQQTVPNQTTQPQATPPPHK